MTETQREDSAFVGYLAGLAARKDRGALAALRRGLGRPPGMAPELYPHVVRFFGSPLPDRENAMFTVAAIFGVHPHHRTGAGSPLKVLRSLDLESGSTERRVLSLLNADLDALPVHLRHLVSLIRSHGPERPLDYQALLDHLVQWEAPSRWVQRRWARDWWDPDTRPPAPPTEAEAISVGMEENSS